MKLRYALETEAQGIFNEKCPCQQYLTSSKKKINNSDMAWEDDHTETRAEALNKRARARLDRHIERIPETEAERDERIQVCNTARELRSRLEGFVPLMGSTPRGLPTYVDAAANTLQVFTSNRRHTHEAVMEAIWSRVPNCSAVHVQVVGY